MLQSCQDIRQRAVSYSFEFPQVIVWDCLNNYEYDNAIFLAERLHAEGKHFTTYPRNKYKNKMNVSHLHAWKY